MRCGIAGSTGQLCSHSPLACGAAKSWFRLHDLRHSRATQLLAAGIHPKTAQERLGHSTITTALDLYSHVSETMQEDAAAKLDTAFRAAQKGPR